MIEEYRELLAAAPGHGGGHPPRGRHPARPLRLAVRPDRRRGLAQGRGRQPHRLLQGPRHDGRDLAGEARRRRGRGVRLDRQHLGVDGRLRRQGRAQAARAGARGQDRRRQDGAGDHPRRPDHHGARQLRPLPADGQGALLGLPRRAGELGQPGPARGAEDRRLRDRRLPRRRPRLPPAARRQRRQHLGVLARLHAVRRPRAGHEEARHAGLPGRGRRPAGDGRAVPRPRDQGDRHPDRQPGLVEAGRGGAQRVRRPVRRRQRRPDPGRPARARLAATASSSSPPRRPASPGCCRSSRRGSPTPAARSSSP